MAIHLFESKENDHVFGYNLLFIPESLLENGHGFLDGFRSRVFNKGSQLINIGE